MSSSPEPMDEYPYYADLAHFLTSAETALLSLEQTDESDIDGISQEEIGRAKDVLQKLISYLENPSTIPDSQKERLNILSGVTPNSIAEDELNGRSWGFAGDFFKTAYSYWNIVEPPQN